MVPVYPGSAPVFFNVKHCACGTVRCFVNGIAVSRPNFGDTLTITARHIAQRAAIK